MKKIAIVVDSSSGIKNGEWENVYVIPLGITESVNGKIKIYEDGVNINNNEVSEKIRKGIDIKTSQCTIGQIMTIMDEIHDKYDRIYALPIPGTLSGSLQTWQSVTNEYSKLRVLPQYMVSLLTKWTVEDFLEMHKNGTLTDESAQKYLDNATKKRVAAVLVPDIKQLVKGGRISNLKSFIINAFNLKLVLSLDEKGLKLCGKSSKIDGCFEVMKKYIDKHTGDSRIKRMTMLVSEVADSSFKIPELMEMAKKFWPEVDFQIGSLPSVIVVHSGCNYIAVGIDRE